MCSFGQTKCRYCLEPFNVERAIGDRGRGCSPVMAVLVGIVVVAGLAVTALPISRVVPPAFMVGRHPDRAGIRRAGPISFVPLVMVTHWVPVTCDKRIPGPRISRLHLYNMHGGRRTDPDSYGKLRKCSSGGEQR